jgi:hypothetical protein
MVKKIQRVKTKVLPSESQTGSSKCPSIILERITASSSSSNGSVPVKRQYRMIPKDQTSTSEGEMR